MKVINLQLRTVLLHKTEYDFVLILLLILMLRSFITACDYYMFIMALYYPDLIRLVEIGALATYFVHFLYSNLDRFTAMLYTMCML